MDSPAFAAPEIGSGLTTFTINGQPLAVDLVGFQAWYSTLADDPADPFARTKAIARRILADNGMALNLSQADELIHQIGLRLEEVRVFRERRWQEARSTASTS